jgi:hypothetical protein
MNRPRLTIREMVLIVVVALGLMMAIKNRLPEGLAVAVALGDREIDRAGQTIDQPRQDPAECTAAGEGIGRPGTGRGAIRHRLHLNVQAEADGPRVARQGRERRVGHLAALQAAHQGLVQAR